MNERFSYIFNALLYNYWLGELCAYKFVDRLMTSILTPFLYLFPNNIRKKIKNRVAINKMNSRGIWDDKSSGFGISMAKSTYWLIISLPIEIFIGAIMFIICVSGVNIEKPLFLIIFVGLSLLLMAPFENAIKNKRYLKYFKEFEKKDEEWHRKWKIITISFSAGMILSVPLILITLYFLVNK